jgi:hypothetical protein
VASQYIKLPVTSGGGGGAGVDSFNGRTGIVVSQAGDYSAGIVSNTPAGNISATDVQGAINELDSEKQATITGAATTIVSANLPTDVAVISNGFGKIATSAITTTELSRLSGVSSNIQAQLDVKQPLDSDLTALAGLGTTGLISRTGAGTVATRSITGNSDILVADGNGVANNPALSLSTTGVTAGTYNSANVTVDSRGRITTITPGVLPPYNPDLSVAFKDDFTGAAVTSGSYGFSVGNSGAGAASTIVSTGINNTLKALGVMQMSTGTTTTGRSTVSTGLTSFAAGYSIMNCSSRLWLPSAGTVPDPFEFTFGFLDNTGATQQHIDGVYFRFLGNGVNVNWEIVTSAANVQTTTTTSSPVLVNNPQIFAVYVNEDATLAQFYIDGVLVGSHATNIPTGAQLFGFGWKILKTAGVSAQQAFVDWGDLNITFTAPRG